MGDPEGFKGMGTLLSGQALARPSGHVSSMEVAPEPAVCATCGDAGFVRKSLPLGDPAFGKAFPCPVCTRPSESQGIPEDLMGLTFEDFDHRLNPSMRQAFDRCKAITEGHEWSTVLVGDYGTGKSMLASCALQELVGRFWDYNQLCLYMRQLMFTHGVDEIEVVSVWQSSPDLLVLDDVGAENKTPWSTSALFSILHARYKARLPTIVTSNTPEALDGRILDRYGWTICSGQSVRELMRQGRYVRRQKGA